MGLPGHERWSGFVEGLALTTAGCGRLTEHLLARHRGTDWQDLVKSCAHNGFNAPCRACSRQRKLGEMAHGAEPRALVGRGRRRQGGAGLHEDVVAGLEHLDQAGGVGDAGARVGAEGDGVEGEAVDGAVLGVVGLHEALAEVAGGPGVVGAALQDVGVQRAALVVEVQLGGGGHARIGSVPVEVAGPGAGAGAGRGPAGEEPKVSRLCNGRWRRAGAPLRAAGPGLASATCVLGMLRVLGVLCRVFRRWLISLVC